MTADIEKLKALALAAQIGGNLAMAFETMGEFQAAATPAAVLELCNENTDLRAEVERLRAEKEAPGLYALPSTRVHPWGEPAMTPYIWHIRREDGITASSPAAAETMDHAQLQALGQQARKP